MRSSLRMGGSSSTTRILSRCCVMRTPIPCSDRFGTGSSMVNTAPVRSVRFAAADAAAEGLDEAARDGEAKPCAGTHLVTFLRPVELVKDALQVRGRNAIAFIENLQLDATLLAANPECERSFPPAHTWRRCRED